MRIAMQDPKYVGGRLDPSAGRSFTSTVGDDPGSDQSTSSLAHLRLLSHTATAPLSTSGGSVKVISPFKEQGTPVA